MTFNPRTCDVHAFIQDWANRKADEEWGKSKVTPPKPRSQARSPLKRHSVGLWNLFKSEVKWYTVEFFNP